MSAVATLRPWCARLVRFVAGCVLDPHRGFEQQLLGELAAADDPRALAELADRLAGWIEDGLIDALQRRRLAAELARDGLPTPGLLRRCPELATALLDPATPPARIAALWQAAAPGSVGDPDRQLVRARAGGLPDGGAPL